MGNSAAHSMQPEIVWVGSGEVVGAVKCDDAILRFAPVEDNCFATLNLISVELPFLRSFSLNNGIVKITHYGLKPKA